MGRFRANLALCACVVCGFEVKRVGGTCRNALLPLPTAGARTALRKMDKTARLDMETIDRVRIDKWLWAVRLYKSRSLATEACTAGHVKLAGQALKPAREVRPGEVITALTGHIHRTVRVLAVLERRVGAKVVKDYLEDLTPAEEYTRARQEAAEQAVVYPKGLGRPTKKQRRLLQQFFSRPGSE